MEQRPSWEAKSHSTTQEVPHLLWSTKVHYHVLKSPPLVRFLNLMHPDYPFPLSFPKIYPNTVLKKFKAPSFVMHWMHPELCNFIAVTKWTQTKCLTNSQFVEVTSTHPQFKLFSHKRISLWWCVTAVKMLYNGRLKSSWTHLITPCRNFVGASPRTFQTALV
jgi:hypothetical protein